MREKIIEYLKINQGSTTANICHAFELDELREWAIIRAELDEMERENLCRHETVRGLDRFYLIEE